jgi:glycosyltransferase involved in cell wall biosynthesis
LRIVCTVTNDLISDQRMIRTCLALHSQGHSVLLIGRNTPHSHPLKSQVFQQKRLSCFFHKGKLFYLEYNLRLWVELLQTKADVLCSVDLDTALAGWFLTRFRRVYWVIDCHEWFPFVPEVERRPWIQKFWLAVERFTLTRAQNVYTVGTAIAERLKTAYNIPVKVVRNMPMLTEIAPDKARISLPDQPFILYQGAVNEGRGLERLIDVLEQTNFHLVIAGTGDVLESLKERVAQKDMQNRVHFLGFIAPDNLPFLTQHARIGYNVSEPLSQSYYLSLNNKFFDYTHAQLPSIINDFEEYRSLCQEYEVGILVKNQNDDILKALNLLMNDDALYQHLKNQCNLARHVWNWQNESEVLKEIYPQNGA